MRAHFIEDKENIILYLPDSLKFFKINPITKCIVNDMLNCNNKEFIINKYKLTENKYNYINSIILNTGNIKCKCENTENLYKLILNITNVCNLNCTYCYANGGNYDSEEAKMDKHTIKKALDLYFYKYKNIYAIQLFGGEPTLNLDAIEFVGDYIDKKYQLSEIEFKPIISLITNGTCSNEKFIQLINKYDIQVTVSIDGPKCINDKTRVLKNGLGSSDIVINNILKLKENTNQPQSAEATFTQYHLNNNIQVSDVLNYINKDLGIENVHIAPVSAEKSKDFCLKNKNSFIESIPKIINNGDKTYMIVDRIIKTLTSKSTSKYICNAGISTFSVSTNGDVYPCFMFTDIDKYKLGNIFIDDLNIFDKPNTQLNSFTNFNKFNSEKCGNCFNNTLCNGCMGINYFATGDAYECSQEECEFMKSLTEKTILSLCKAN